MINAEARDGSLAWRHYDLKNVWHLTTNKRIAGIAKFLLKMYKTTRIRNILNMPKMLLAGSLTQESSASYR